jgi:hypothetical protein
MLHAAFFARFILDPEDGGGMFLRNVGSHMDYTVLYPRRSQPQILHNMPRSRIFSKARSSVVQPYDMRPHMTKIRLIITATARL